MSTLPLATTVRLHMSLNVSDFERSVTFYRILFGTEPTKHRSDYAKFELEEPDLVLSLEPSAHAGGGPLNHLGFRMPDAATLVAMQERLERAGIRSQREEGVECCYAKQTKFWVRDPDQTLWEVYTFEGDLDHRGPGQAQEQMAPQQPVSDTAKREVWEHRMGSPVPDVLPLEENSVDEVSLRGTFNLPMAEADITRLLNEAHRVLRPNGKLFVHVLTAESPLTKTPELPGPASVVQYCPLESEPPTWLATAGFARVEMAKFDAKPCFTSEGVGLRELQLIGFKPEVPTSPNKRVLYKGPLAQLRDDLGNVYVRGQRVVVSDDVVDALKTGPMASQFVVFED